MQKVLFLLFSVVGMGGAIELNQRDDTAKTRKLIRREKKGTTQQSHVITPDGGSFAHSMDLGSGGAVLMTDNKAYDMEVEKNHRLGEKVETLEETNHQLEEKLHLLESSASLSEKALIAKEILRHSKAIQSIRAASANTPAAPQASASAVAGTAASGSDSDFGNTAQQFPANDIRNRDGFANVSTSDWECGVWNKRELEALTTNTHAKKSWTDKCQHAGHHPESVCSEVAMEAWKDKGVDGDDFVLDDAFCMELFALTTAHLEQEAEKATLTSLMLERSSFTVSYKDGKKNLAVKEVYDMSDGEAQGGSRRRRRGSNRQVCREGR